MAYEQYEQYQAQLAAYEAQQPQQAAESEREKARQLAETMLGDQGKPDDQNNHRLEAVQCSDCSKDATNWCRDCTSYNCKKCTKKSHRQHNVGSAADRQEYHTKHDLVGKRGSYEVDESFHDAEVIGVHQEGKHFLLVYNDHSAEEADEKRTREGIRRKTATGKRPGTPQRRKKP